ncbi:MAG TPA: hypothetical protein VF015_04555, partial [Acidimicrobiales bacterium]
MSGSPASRRVVIVAYPDVQSLDVTGPLEVFAVANRFGATPAYTTEVVTLAGGVVRTSSGLGVVADGTTAGCRGPIDTLLVAGGDGTAAAMR